MIHEEDGLPGRQPAQPEPSRAPQPGQLRTRAEYLAALRELRTWSGLTYRELEAKAGTYADSLPASTIATTLGRTSLPRERFVDAFTRACGLAEQDVGPWLEARRRIAAHEQAPPPPEKDDDREPAPPPAAPVPRWRWAAGLLAAVGIGAGGTLGVQALLPDGSGPGEPRAAVSNPAVPGLGLKAVGSWAEIRPARSPELCVSEGTDRTGRYRSAVAAQQPCAQAALPRVYLEPVGDGAVQIQWHHPEHGIGCLTAMGEGPGRGLLEPREACADDDPAQRFRLEAAGKGADRRFRIRPDTGECLAPRDEDTAPGAEIARTRCSGAAEQEFTVSLTPPP
ncbi:XRE family transcriptional regulator [Streptomyces sp. NBC_01808]|uniref:helix-turn-helix domain-containing protein n=1 Tax=Streptomyces sp. NBC_01808 TaxID=2975947 RepID=UPI002DD91075|nr:helix-turn-helix domain-containing protein [Streptomyces sp. NBC_01808]WSA38447.1 XRE family transcriptional regulator [Streptomyces sp. NBC_01808]